MGAASAQVFGSAGCEAGRRPPGARLAELTDDARRRARAP
jgi:hypothetical protein